MSNPRLASSRHQRSPRQIAMQRAAEFGSSVLRALTKDPLSTFLLVASITLAILFFTLLGSLKPEATGERVALTNITTLAKSQRIRSAVLLDHDHQVVAHTDTGLQIYADYPSSDAITLSLIETLSKGGAEVTVNQQSSKPARQIVIQFLIPIRLLVCLFAFFTRQSKDSSGGIASFSNFKGKGKRKKRGQSSPITFD